MTDFFNSFVMLLTVGTACNSGYYSLGGNTACIPCPGGYSCASTSSSPVLCTAGNYANNASASCKPCAAGYYCPTDSMSEPLACPTGYYQTSTGQTSCTECAQGTKGAKWNLLRIRARESLKQGFSHQYY